MKRWGFLLLSILVCISLLPAVALAEEPAQSEEPAEPTAAEIHNLQESAALSTYSLEAVSVTRGQYNEHNPAKGDYYINLQTEKIYMNPALPSEMQMVFISTDGGNKWKSMSISPEDTENAGEGGTNITKLLNKGGTFVLASSITDKQPTEGVKEEKDEEGNIAKDAVPGANVYQMGTFQKRPGAPKCKVDYLTYADNKGESNGQWTVDISTEGLQVAPSNNKKTPNDGIYYEFKKKEGATIFDSGSKVVKYTYLIRIAPDPQSRTPASKAKKVSASSTLKVTTFKIDYKKELIKTKAGAIYVEATEKTQTDENGEEETVFEWVSPKSLSPFDKETAKSGIALVQKAMVYSKDGSATDEVSHYGKTLMVRMSATEKKPASAIQTITVMPRKRAYEVDFKPNISSGSFKVPSGMEYYSADKGKWITTTIKTAGSFLLRFKNKAKHNGKSNSTSGDVTSLPIELNLIEGTYGSNNKTGVVDYEVTNFPRYPGLVVGRVNKPADNEQDRYAYEITPKDYFLDATAQGSSEAYSKPISIELTGLLKGGKLQDAEDNDMALALYPDGETPTLNEGTVYVKIELESGISNKDKILVVDGAQIQSGAAPNLNFNVRKPASDAVTEFPSGGTVFSVKISLHEKEGQELCLRDKFTCRDITFTFNIPTYKLALKSSGKLTYAVSADGSALTKEFTGTAESFRGLKITEMSVPSLTIYNQKPSAWTDDASATVELSSSNDKFYVWSGDDAGNDKLVEVASLTSKLHYYDPTDPADSGGSGDEDEILSYFFVKDKDGNLFPFRLVISTQDDIEKEVTYLATNTEVYNKDYNALTVTLSTGTFLPGGDAGDSIDTGLFQITLSSTSSSSSSTLGIHAAKLSNINKTVTLYLDSKMFIDDSSNKLKLNIQKDAFAPGTKVEGKDVTMAPMKENLPAITATRSGISGNEVTLNVTIPLPGSNLYSFRKINVIPGALWDRYVKLYSATSTLSTADLTSVSVNADKGSNTMTVVILFKNADMAKSNFSISVLGESFLPVGIGETDQSSVGAIS